VFFANIGDIVNLIELPRSQLGFGVDDGDGDLVGGNGLNRSGGIVKLFNEGHE
jgi:hypothetical protein